MRKIGIIGCGTIGSYLAERIDKDFKSSAKIIGLCDADKEKALVLSKKLSNTIPVYSINEIIKKSDLVIEAASAKISADICKKALDQSKDIMIMSIGGILSNYKNLFLLAKKKNARVILPSGAICGLDGVKSASSARITKASLTTRKPPKGLKGAPYIVEKRIDLDSIKEETVIFEGTAEEAVSAFPQNINVCAVLSIASLGPKNTKVKIVTSPEYTKNIHEIEIEGDFGKIFTRTENVPSPDNPKTSFLAALSALTALRQVLDESVRVGT